jgi:hypothetical protein
MAGCKTLGGCGDVSDQASVENMIKITVDAFGGLQYGELGDSSG